MAFRGRRGFRRVGRRRQRASAFAPARVGPQNLGWEAAGSTCWDLANTEFGLIQSQNIDCNGVQTQYDTLGMVLIPGNVTRGTVTLKRVKAHIGFFQEAVNPTQLRFQLNTFQCLLQLVPLSDGQPFGMLAANNAGDLESNRIIWRQTMHYASTPTGVPFTGVDAWGIAWSDIDVKSQRRFSRAQWALVFTCTALATWQDETRIYANFRMLFATGDGM